MHSVRIKSPVFPLLFLSCWVLAQTPSATISGRILDQTRAVIPGAIVEAVDTLTNIRRSTQTNQEGLFTLADLPPGEYRIEVSKAGFRTVIKPGVSLHIQDLLALNFVMSVGSTSETVTVEGGAPLISVESAAVSTVVERKYIENIPLNGRSFQSLILLTPGVVTNSPQSSGTLGFSGEFSVNGQRTESNYYTVDGVSANTGIFPGDSAGPGNGGAVPLSTALGTTQALVSLDGLQEFRIQSSTYSAEFGRNPGGQLSFATRSGTNHWRGVAFDYLRNDFFDASDWFNGFFGRPKPRTRQNDFGGVLGGPLEIPHIYDGRDRTFFFFSYEGLRLAQPQAANLSYVPSMSLRQSAPAAVQSVLNAWPVPNGIDLGNGLAQFIGSWSNPGEVDSTGIRFDHTLSQNLKLFFRFSDTSSDAQARQSGNVSGTPANNLLTQNRVRTYTVGATSSISANLTDDFRFGYSSNSASSSYRIDSFGGGTPVDLAALQGIDLSGTRSYQVGLGLFISGNNTALFQGPESGTQHQWNIVDTLNVLHGRNALKLGVDYRRSAPEQTPFLPFVEYLYFSQKSIQANSVDEAIGQSRAAAYPLYSNFSAFVEDELRATSRLNLSMGLRWEVNPAPSAAQGGVPYTVRGSDFSTLALAPQGTPLWDTTWFNFAPRFGAIYRLRDQGRYVTLVRGGIGVFFDTGQQEGSQGYIFGPGFFASTVVGNLVGSPSAFPAPLGKVTPALVNPPVAPYPTVSAFPEHLQLPYTLQWNTTVEQGLGSSQALSLSYVGSRASRLIEKNQLNISPFNKNFQSVIFYQNGSSAYYDALQAQFQSRLGSKLSALASYTWAHSIDYGSTYTTFPYVKGNSDFDLRHNFSAAASYDPGISSGRKLAGYLLNGWGFDERINARTAFPVTLRGSTLVDAATGRSYYAGLNLVPGQALYLYGRQFPGGRSVNPLAFSKPSGSQIGNAPRNFVRGFGDWQMDLAVRREFPLQEKLKLQFRAEAFNVFNHPNFGLINPVFCSPGPGCTFGQTIATLAQSLGVLNPLYQTGGPRSMQFTAKLIF